MIILDTNVVSEPLKPKPNPTVLAWLDAQVAESLYLTTTSLAELWLGAELMPAGRRQNYLRSILSNTLTKLFAHRILPFDRAAAMKYAKLITTARAKGHTIKVADGQIAAVAAAHGFAVASRDVGPFKGAGVPLINPWDFQDIHY